tara:strand:- start:1651 stop:2721 length:1071 start_codon:yes stop_codon:yes gene_type:complete
LNKISLIATIGPSCNSLEALLRLREAGVSIFRVNMSHSSIKDLTNYANLGLENNIRIGLDTEGAQLRTVLRGVQEITLKKGDEIKIYNDLRENEELKSLSLYPKDSINQLEHGCIIRLDFNGASVIVESEETSYINCKCLSPGKVGNNKGVDIINKRIFLPDFTQKDYESLDKINELGIKEVFISFCKSKEAVYSLKKLYPDIKITSKIENKSSIHNLHSICEASDSILIDRGDLTREINILDIPFAQRGIINVANKYNTPCYVATNIFESLITGSLPTRAELNDIVGTIEMGAAGLVLAAETAIGKKPLLSVEIVQELIHRYNLHKDGLLFADIERNEITDSEMKLWINRNNQIY